MERLKRLRSQRGYSQRRLADLSGIDQGSISEIEAGKRSPSVATLERLVQAMDAEMSDLFPKVQESLFEEAEQRRPPEAAREGYAQIIDAWAEHVRARAGSWESAAGETGGVQAERVREELRQIFDTSREILGAIEDPRPLVPNLVSALSEMDHTLARVDRGFDFPLLLELAGLPAGWDSGRSLSRHIKECSDPGCEICHPPEGFADNPETNGHRVALFEELVRSRAS